MLKLSETCETQKEPYVLTREGENPRDCICSWNVFQNTHTVLHKSIMLTSTIAHVTFMASLHWATSSNVSFLPPMAGKLWSTTHLNERWVWRWGWAHRAALLGANHMPGTLHPHTVWFLAHPPAPLTYTSRVLLKPMLWMNHWLFKWLPRSPAPPAQPAEMTLVPLTNAGSSFPSW